MGPLEYLPYQFFQQYFLEIKPQIIRNDEIQLFINTSIGYLGLLYLASDTWHVVFLGKTR